MPLIVSLRQLGLRKPPADKKKLCVLQQNQDDKNCETAFKKKLLLAFVADDLRNYVTQFNLNGMTQIDQILIALPQVTKDEKPDEINRT